MKEKQTKPKKKEVLDERERKLKQEKAKRYKELIRNIPDPTPWERFGINE